MVNSELKFAYNMTSFLLRFFVCQLVMLIGGCFGRFSNKLKGKHNKELDAAEYMRIIEQGEKDYLKALLASVGERLPQELLDREFSVSIPATYEIIVECKDEADQKSIFEKLKSEGYKLRILTL